MDRPNLEGPAELFAGGDLDARVQGRPADGFVHVVGLDDRDAADHPPGLDDMAVLDPDLAADPAQTPGRDLQAGVHHHLA